MEIRGRKKKGANDNGNVKQTLVQFPTSPEGCDAMGGDWDKKTGLCDALKEEDPATPNIKVIKKFDKVERPSDISGAQSIEGF